MFNNLYEEINNCISVVDNEINLHKKNMKADGDVETLNIIKQQLIDMSKYMSPRKYIPNYNYIIRDSLWNYLKIADVLLRVYHKYIKL